MGLMDQIKRGPSSRFHALLRACALTNQEHIIRELGLEPEDYGEAAAPSGVQKWRSQRALMCGKKGNILLSYSITQNVEI